MGKTEMKMLRRIKEVTLTDGMRSTDIRKELRMERIADGMGIAREKKKMTQLNW